MDPIIGQIQPFAFNYPPRYWAACNGATIPISQNTALFSLIGVVYGGNGTTNFMLPNLTARGACNQGTGPGLSPRDIGSTFGENQVSLNASEMPTHSHSLTVYAQPDDGKRSGAPENGSGLAVPRDSSPYADPGALVTFAPGMLGLSGGGQPHENRQPFLALGFCIAMAGIFPQFG